MVPAMMRRRGAQLVALLVGLALLAGLGVPALHLLWGAWVRRHRGREKRP